MLEVVPCSPNQDTEIVASEELPPAAALRRIYQMGEKAEEDWSSICDRVLAPGQGDAPKLPREVAEVRQRNEFRREHVQVCLNPLQWYSINVPQVDQEIPASHHADN